MIALSLAGRAVAVYPVCLAFARTRWAIPLNQQHLMWWGGLRGALALALALSCLPTCRGATTFSSRPSPWSPFRSSSRD